MTDFLDLLPTAVEAIDTAARIMRHHQPGTLTVKGDRDMASEVDYTIERAVRNLLHQRTPTIGFLGEEEGPSGAAGGELTWTLDPVDGTANYVRGVPLCGISLGLLHHDQPVLGVIDTPLLGTRYHAVTGHGAYANGHPIHASTTSRLTDAIVAHGDYAVGAGAEAKNQLRLAIARHLAARAQRVRMHGSAAIDLAWLAHGRLDAVITMSNKPWDMTAGVVIAREAGAHIVDTDGTPHALTSTATIGAPPTLITDILTLLHDARTPLSNGPDVIDTGDIDQC